jgi:hypothetical protein
VRVFRRFGALLGTVPLIVAPAAVTTWTIVPSPNPHVALNGLSAVSARGASDAWAVGVFGETQEEDEQGGLLLHWDGTAWSFVRGPNPQFRNERLDAVQGVAANDVWAVGALATAVNQLPKVPWALHWDGRNWSEVAVPTGPNPGGTGRGGLRGLAARQADNVWAVGKSPGVTALVEHWNGTSWSVTPTPTVRAGLNAVAAVSDRDIWAVGDGLVNPDGSKTALIMHYDGTSWKVMPNQVSVPSTFVAHRGLTSIAALSATDIWAVGTATDRLSVDQPVIQHYDGRTWTRVAAPAKPANATHFGLTGIASTTSGLFAVGGLSHTDLTEDAVALRWSGTAWSFESTQHTAATSDGFTGVTDATGGHVWAVGQSFFTNARRTLIERR